jgi:uncharacterized membrane protein
MDLMACVFDGADDAGVVARRLRQAVGATSDCAGWAVARWDADAARPTTETSGPAGWEDTNLAWFWSLVLGVTFRVPLLSAAVGSATGLDAQMLGPAGIHDTLLNRLRDEVTPGRSALVILTGPSTAATLRGLVHQTDVLVLGSVPITSRQQTVLLGAAS